MNDNSHSFPLDGGNEKTLKIQALITDLLKKQLDIEAALEYAHNSHTFDDVVEMVLVGRLHFYPTGDSFVIMEVLTYPQHKVYHTFLAGGNMEEIFNIHDTLHDNAKKLECSYTSVVGRKGWEKALKSRGWKYSYSTLYREVT